MKKEVAIFLAAVLMLSMTACGGSTDSAAPESASLAASESTETAADTGVMYNFYSTVGENLKNGKVDGYDGYFTDAAMGFLAEHDELFENNMQLSDADQSYLADAFDLRDVEKNPDRNTSELFYGTGMITDIREETLDDNTYATEGLILYDGLSSTEEYCYFICSGSVPLYAGDEVEFVALPLGVGNVDLTDNTKQRCVYIACTYLQGLEGQSEAADSSQPENSAGDDEDLSPISAEDRIISNVYGAVWPGWAEQDPVYPEYKDLSYGAVLDYLFEDSGYCSWNYDEASNSVKLSGTYTTFNYTMGIADEPTACDVELTFTVDQAGDWVVSGFRGDECESGEHFMELAYSYYYQGNCY